jgi:uncharacterized membrane protein HdeD (DUF308 family)
MEAWLGTTWPVYLGITLVLMGAAAYATGRAVAGTWRPPWQVFLYCFLLSLAGRFLIYALFQGELLSGSGFATDFSVLTVAGLAGYRITWARQMVSQYPWLYRRRGFWGVEQRKPG